VLRAAARHEGAALVEIYQNCPVFNDGAFAALTEKGLKEVNQVHLVQGEPVPGVVRLADGGLAWGEEGEPVVHDAHRRDPAQAFALARLSDRPVGPTPLGVFRDVERPVWGRELGRRLEEARAGAGPEQLESLLHGHDTWTVA
jgi:2-oxoglutarate/2-oxoacid ferredoxin oxidoreductase subunit beta